jgi:hypothetical protein
MGSRVVPNRIKCSNKHVQICIHEYNGAYNTYKTAYNTYNGAWNKYKYFFESKYFSILEICHRGFTDIHRKFTDIHRKQRNNGAFTKRQ